MDKVVHFVLCELIQKIQIFDKITVQVYTIIIPFCPRNNKIIKLVYVCACKNGLC